MAPITDKKRKSAPTNESFARSKKLRAEEPDAQGENVTRAPKIPHVPKITRVREEEVAFPRGGASVLTPLEHKQIQIEATRDVLFEQGARATEAGEESGISDKKKKPITKGKGKGKGKKDSAADVEEEDNVRIEGLSYKVCQASVLLFICR